ncbi:hypothetical protein [Candidatus Arsenophonus triatominarum]
MAICAAFKLEGLRIKNKLNPFVSQATHQCIALCLAYAELQKFRATA